MTMQRIFLAFFLMIAGASRAYAQGAATDTILGPNVAVRPNASVTICSHPSTVSSCTANKVPLFSDLALTIPTTNPTTTDAQGKFLVYVASGTYDYIVTGSGITPQTSVFTFTIGGSGGGAIPASPANCVQLSNSSVNALATTSASGVCLGVDNVISPTKLAVPFSEAISGPRPWIDVTAPPYNADPTGATDSTAAINSAITAACSTSGSYVPTILFPAGTYSVTQTQTGVSSTAAIFTIPCSFTHFLGMGSGPGTSFATSPLVKIQTTAGASPNDAAVFYTNGKTSTTIENLEVVGYNKAIDVDGTETQLINACPQTFPTGHTDNTPLFIHDTIEFKSNGGCLDTHSNAVPLFIIAPTNSSSSNGIDWFSNQLWSGGSPKLDLRVPPNTGVIGDFLFRNIFLENCSSGDFLDITGSNSAVIQGIVMDNVYVADCLSSGYSINVSAPSTTLAFPKMDTVFPSLIKVAGAGSTVTGAQTSGWPIDNPADNTRVICVDNSGNPTSGCVSKNDNGFDMTVDGITGNGGALNNNMWWHEGSPIRMAAKGSLLASIALDPHGLFFSNSTSIGYNESLQETSTGNLDLYFSNSTPVGSLATSPTTGGTLGAGTYYYTLLPCSSSCSLYGSPATPVQAVVSGGNNAVTLTWTLPTSASVPNTDFRVERTTNPFFLQIGGGTCFVAQVGSGSAVTFTDIGSNMTSSGSCASSALVTRHQQHRFTFNALGVNTTSPAQTLDVNGTGHFASFVDVTEIAAPANPSSGNERWYADSSSHLISCLTSSGGNCAPSVGGAPAFSSITSATNTTATMTVGTGSTLTFSGSGTVNASTLGGATFAAPGPIGGTTPNTGTFTNLTDNGLTASLPVCTTAGKVLSSTCTGLIPNAALTNSSTTFNGQAVALGGTGNVNSGAASHTVALNEGAGAAITGVALGAHQTLIGAVGADPTAKTVTDCNGSSNALNFTQSTDTFSCNSIATIFNPMTGPSDMIQGTTAGAVARLAAPSSPDGLVYTLTSTPAGGTVAASNVWGLAAVPVNSQSGAGYTLAYTDRAHFLSLSNASAQTLTLPAIAGNFATNFPFVTQNIGAGAWTITPTTQTINGASTDLLAPKMAAFVYQDSTPNWFSINFPTVQAFPDCQDSSGNHVNWNSTTRVFTCGTTSSGGNFYQTVDSNASAATQRPTLNLISGTNATVNCVDNSGASRTDCTVSASVAAGSRLDQLTAATAGNTINSTVNPQVWNWALTGSTNGMTFGENTAATGSGNTILDTQTLASSTASPFTATARGTTNGVQVSSTGTLAALGSGHVNADQINGGAFTGTQNDVVAFGASNVPLDTAVLYTNLVTQTSNASNGQVCTYTGTNKVCVPATALPNGVTATTQSAGDSSADVATDSFVSTAINNAIAGVNPAVAVLAASTSNQTGTYSNGTGGIGATFTITATGAYTLDGISINAIGQRVLFKNQTSAFQNGVYTATVVGTTGVSPVFTRAVDYDAPSDINSTGAIPVQSGTANTTTSWLLTSTVNTVGTDSLTYVQFSIAPSTLVTAAATLTNNQLVFGAGGQGVAIGDLTGDVTTSGGKATTIANNAVTGAKMANATVTATQLAAQYSKRSCTFGLGDGVNAIAAATYPASGQILQCVNNSGVTWTVTGLHCFTDNAGTSTANVYNNAGTSLLTGAITCNATKTSGGAAGTQSGTTTIATTDGLNFVFVADGTSKYVTVTVDFTY